MKKLITIFLLLTSTLSFASKLSDIERGSAERTSYEMKNFKYVISISNAQRRVAALCYQGGAISSALQDFVDTGRYSSDSDIKETAKLLMDMDSSIFHHCNGNGTHIDTISRQFTNAQSALKRLIENK